MTDEQINAAIADVISPRLVLGKCKFYKSGEGWVVDCPNYCTDLNAMHEAEGILYGGAVATYAECLSYRTGAQRTDDKKFFCATARQRAEAFLMLLGKWEDK